MTRLFSYCIPCDTGAAPNPYWGILTLVICKPAIRRTATIGDRIVGTGSTNSPIGDMSGKVVYGMEVTQKLSMREYDAFVKESLPNKIPNWRVKDPRRKLGDSIYDYQQDTPKLRLSVHDKTQMARDLRGEFALLSKKFWYFGDKPINLPEELLGIVKQGPGHRVNSNQPYLEPFLEWLYTLELPANKLYGKPQKKVFGDHRLLACST